MILTSFGIEYYSIQDFKIKTRNYAIIEVCIKEKEEEKDSKFRSISVFKENNNNNDKSPVYRDFLRMDSGNKLSKY